MVLLTVPSLWMKDLLYNEPTADIVTDMTKKYQRVGLHVSAAGGVENAPKNAQEMGVEVFQFFSRSPRGGGAPDISDEQAKEFRAVSRENDFESYIHTPYYVNLASKNKKIYHGSVNVLREELERGSKLGVKYVVTHLGSAKDWVEDKKSTETPKEALEQVAKGLKEVYKGQPSVAPRRGGEAMDGEKQFTSKLLLEIAAGSGSVIGDTFEELGWLLKKLGRKDVHICLDTCHMFAAGYDIRDEAALDETMKQFRKHIGASHLKLVHMNDSMTDFNGRVDRHEHLGKGKIRSKGLIAVLKHKDFQKVNFILETKHDAFIEKDLAFLKRNRQVK